MNNLLKPYHHSPKIAIVTGHPSAGKTTLAKKVVDQFAWQHFSLDAVNTEIAANKGIKISALNDPNLQSDFHRAFVKHLRATRYVNLLAEGCRFVHPHILNAFVEAARKVYGDYLILQCFFLNPPSETRHSFYLKRKAEYEAELGQTKDDKRMAHLRKQLEKPFDSMQDPIPDDFVEAQSIEDLWPWFEKADQAYDPELPTEFADLIAKIANSATFDPFYQTIEVNGQRIIEGYTKTYRGWEHFEQLGIELSGKTVCEIGCHHGYYLFRAEEKGAVCSGLDIDAGAIEVANIVAQARNSKTNFKSFDCCTEELPGFDLILAMSMLHRTADYQVALANILDHCREAVLEINLTKEALLTKTAANKNFELRNKIATRQAGGVFGARAVFHFEKKA